MNKFLLLTVFCSLCVIVGTGHGIAPIGLAMPILLDEIFSGEFSLTGTYTVRLPAAALTMLVGQIVLLVACITRRNKKIIFAYLGIVFLYTSLLIMAIDFATFSIDAYVFLFSILFIGSSSLLLYALITNEHKSK